MSVITKGEVVEKPRKVALELLLSDHVGDCVAPCLTVCPGHLDIPGMNQAIAHGEMEEATEIVMDTMLAAGRTTVVPRSCGTPRVRATLAAATIRAKAEGVRGREQRWRGGIGQLQLHRDGALHEADRPVAPAVAHGDVDRGAVAPLIEWFRADGLLQQRQRLVHVPASGGHHG